LLLLLLLLPSVLNEIKLISLPLLDLPTPEGWKAELT